ncbi:hypothetical protein BASA83_008558 [Batrachochytrium salamandrivorans]|nr:hypothetical protein BASA83_008558 [Batrachochytrium salamandrivorans]
MTAATSSSALLPETTHGEEQSASPGGIRIPSTSSISLAVPEPVPLRVALRVRPAIVQQDGYGVGVRPAPRICVHLVPGEPQVVVGKELELATNPTGYTTGHTTGNTGNISQPQRKFFTFDSIYGPESSQRLIFEELAVPLLNQFYEGFNATILAYGQTFSGKTFTMGSSNDHRTSDLIQGIIPRVVLDIFEHIKSSTINDYQVQVSFVEIYQEQIRDLLMPKNDQREIAVRENKFGVITISGVHEESVSTPAELMRCLERGGVERTTGDTQIHSYSSRSHAIFTITLELISRKASQGRQSMDLGTGHLVIRRSKLQLVDLAGSERLKRTGAEGLRLRESVKINSGLLALGNVISALGTERTWRPNDTLHIPYRDSKLTRLLQDSLGGNSRTIMIACVSPLEEDMDETLNTLKYAYRARKIQNKPVVNMVNHQAAEMSSLHQKINQLQGQLHDRSDQPIAPEKLSPDMIDFDNEQLMQYFMDELKNRTIRGANATKALRTANIEKAELDAQISKLTSQLNNAYDEQQLIALKLEDGNIQLSKTKDKVTALEEDNFILASRLKSILIGIIPTAAEEASTRLLLEKYCGSGWATSNILSDVPAFDSNLNIGHMGSTPLVNSNNAPTIQPFEHDTCEFQQQSLKPEMQLTKENDNQHIMDNTYAEVSLLRQVNSDLQRENVSIQNEMDMLRQVKLPLMNQNSGDSEIMSIKVLNETGCQTEASSFSTIEKIGSDDLDFKVHTSTELSLQLADGQTKGVDSDPNTRQVTQEFNALMKAKVDLLRELTKTNKESEKSRHIYQDGVQKLERELENLQREIIKLKNEQHESEQAKEKLKEEYERKMKTQKTNLLNLKNKSKDLERGIRDKEYSDKRLQESQQEIEKLHTQQVSWRKKLKEDSEKFSELEHRHTKEIAALGRKIEDDSKRIRQLELQVELSRKKLDRKTEELSMVTRKLKDTTLSGNVSGPTKLNRIGSFERSNFDLDRSDEELPVPLRSIDLAGNVQFDTMVDSNALNDESSMVESIPMLEDHRKNTIVEDEQSLTNLRLGEIQEKVDDVETKISKLEESLEHAQATDRDPISGELVTLRRNKTVLLRHIVEIRTKQRKSESSVDFSNNLTDEPKSPHDHLTSNDNIDYHGLIERFADSKYSIEIIPQLRTASLQECRHLVIRCLYKIEYLKGLSQANTESHKLKAQLHAGTDYIAKLEQKSQKQEQIHKRRLLAVEAHFKKQLEQLNAQIQDKNNAVQDSSFKNIEERRATMANTEVQTDMNMAGRFAGDKETINSLEKDVFYYRSANKELKIKLREVVSVNNRLAKNIQKSKGPDYRPGTATESAAPHPELTDMELSAPKSRNSSVSHEDPSFAVAVE